MTSIRGLLKWGIAAAIAFAVGILPSCATMGGGMRYDLLPNFSTAIAEWST